MDKAFWRSIVDSGFVVPEGHNAAEYLPALMEGLGALDPELRDHLCLEVLWSWIDGGRFTLEQLRQIANQMLTNLKVGIRETQGSDVFLRTFSVLILGAVVAYDTKRRTLTADEVRRMLDEGLAYLATEQDLRGYVPVMGWAHSVAHTADLLTALAGHPELNAADLERILYALSDKMLAPTRQALVDREGFRMARTVVAVLSRDLLPLGQAEAWLTSIGAARTRLQGFAAAEDGARYHNVEQFLTAMHLMITYKELPEHVRAALLLALHGALKSFLPHFL